MDKPGGQILKERMGSSREKVGEDKQTDKTFNETLGYHKNAPGQSRVCHWEIKLREAAERRENKKGRGCVRE